MRMILIAISILSAGCLKAQTIDTLVDVGNSRLHFHIVKGTGTPILFEAGGGDAGTVWSSLLGPLHTITGATLITYDRSGYGQSEKDTSLFRIANGVHALAVALRKLGYDQKLMLVAHSMGGFYATMFASKYPERIRSAVFFDINHIRFFTDTHVETMMSKDTSWFEQFKNRVFRNTIEQLRLNPFPTGIPVMDVVAGNTLFKDTLDVNRWRQAHAEFVNMDGKREGITAVGSGHYIFFSNKPLAVQTIVKGYADQLPENLAADIWKRANAYAIASAIEVQKSWTNYLHSENDLNEWGYALLQQNKTQTAVDVFRLNTELFPQSANAFDSLGEGYEKLGQPDLAIKSYRRCVALDPKQKHAEQRLLMLIK